MSVQNRYLTDPHFAVALELDGKARLMLRYATELLDSLHKEGTDQLSCDHAYMGVHLAMRELGVAFHNMEKVFSGKYKEDKDDS